MCVDMAVAGVSGTCTAISASSSCSCSCTILHHIIPTQITWWQNWSGTLNRLNIHGTITLMQKYTQVHSQKMHNATSESSRSQPHQLCMWCVDVAIWCIIIDALLLLSSSTGAFSHSFGTTTITTLCILGYIGCTKDGIILNPCSIALKMRSLAAFTGTFCNGMDCHLTQLIQYIQNFVREDWHHPRQSPPEPLVQIGIYIIHVVRGNGTFRFIFNRTNMYACKTGWIQMSKIS